jgi:NAD(P)-dependent dehydrogenase (short-subunit alcohol dehydrogenase family)
MSRFDGRVAFVTGAAHGQGRATALAFAREGATVAAFDLARPLDYPGTPWGRPASWRACGPNARRSARPA